MMDFLHSARAAAHHLPACLVTPSSATDEPAATRRGARLAAFVGASISATTRYCSVYARSIRASSRSSSSVGPLKYPPPPTASYQDFRLPVTAPPCPEPRVAPSGHPLVDCTIMSARLSPRTIFALDPRTQQRGLLVEVHPEIKGEPPDAHMRTFYERMFDAQIRVGLFVTPLQTVVVRDTLSSMSFSSNVFEHKELVTESLLQAANMGPRGDLYDRFMRWLTAVPQNWMSLLPDDAVAVMVPDVIGHLAQAEFETFDGVLQPRRASA
jgi:hypothetical protein